MRIPLKNGDEIVTEVIFKGRSAISVKGSIRAVDGHTDFAARVRDLVSVSKGMSRSDTTSPLGEIKYWTGFWGWLGGLSVVLPSIGMVIDWKNIEYP